MTIVNSLLFDDHSGAILSDEAYFLLRRRKTYFGDNLHALLTPEQAGRFGVEAVWGMCGYPSFGVEVVEAIRRAVREKEEKALEEGRKKPPITSLLDIGRIAAEVVRRTVHRRVDDKLKFLYGFDRADMIRGSFTAGEKTYEIKQDAVKTNAMSIMDGSSSAQIVKNIHKNIGILFGWDARDGALHYHLNAENFVLSMISGRFEAVGAGKYASGQAFADYLGNQTLRRRREGFGRVEGTFQLILSGILAARFYHEAGGKLHMAVVDGRSARAADRLRFIDEDRLLLATEAVDASRKGFVTGTTAMEVVEAMVYGDATLDEGEAILFKKADRPRALGWFLRGYKASDLPAEAGAKSGGGGKKSRKK